MYQRIMIPTDGSELSTKVALKGIALAAENKAEVVGMIVAPQNQSSFYVGMGRLDATDDKEYEEIVKQAGANYLAPLRQAAEQVGLKFTGEVVISDSPAAAIAKLAEQYQCDLIFMGSHGRSGIGQLFLGSVTAKLLNLCAIPVLVHKMLKAK